MLVTILTRGKLEDVIKGKMLFSVFDFGVSMLVN